MNSKFFQKVLLGAFSLSILAVAPSYAATYSVRCEDFTRSYTACPTPTPVYGVTLTHQRSSAPCVMGETYGIDHKSYRAIWTSNGCRGDFVVSDMEEPLPPPPHPGHHHEVRMIDCSSHDNHFKSCPVGGRILTAQILSQSSHAACIYGRTWGFVENAVWVDRGCRANFKVFVRH